jgi:hypothetical protein
MTGKYEYIEELAKEANVNLYYTDDIINHAEELVRTAGLQEYSNYENLDTILSTLIVLAKEKKLEKVVGVLMENFNEYFGHE